MLLFVINFLSDINVKEINYISLIGDIYNMLYKCHNSSFRILLLQVLEIEFHVLQLTRDLLHVHLYLALLIAQHTQFEGEFVALLRQAVDLLSLLELQ
jgi:hypothetical protein